MSQILSYFCKKLLNCIFKTFDDQPIKKRDKTKQILNLMQSLKSRITIFFWIDRLIGEFLEDLMGFLLSYKW